MENKELKPWSVEGRRNWDKTELSPCAVCGMQIHLNCPNSMQGKKIDELEKENEEQARLLGISGSNELALRASVAELENENKKLKTSLEEDCFNHADEIKRLQSSVDKYKEIADKYAVHTDFCKYVDALKTMATADKFKFKCNCGLSNLWEALKDAPQGLSGEE